MTPIGASTKSDKGIRKKQCTFRYVYLYKILTLCVTFYTAWLNRIDHFVVDILEVYPAMNPSVKLYIRNSFSKFH